MVARESKPGCNNFGEFAIEPDDIFFQIIKNVKQVDCYGNYMQKEPKFFQLKARKTLLSILNLKCTLHNHRMIAN